jgi:undecaprenyl-diphosphatase
VSYGETSSAKGVTPARGARLGVERRAHDVAGVVVAGALLVSTSLLIDEHSVGALEVDAFRILNGLPAAIFPAVWVVMQLGNLLVVPVAVVVALVVRRFRLAAAIAVAGSLVWLLAKVVKDIVPRGRPAELLNNVVLHDAPAAGNGYISGHAAVVFALVAVAAPYLGRRMRYAAWLIAATVCLARVYVGAHLPLDVVGGAAFGWALGSVLNLALGVPPPRRAAAGRVAA